MLRLFSVQVCVRALRPSALQGPLRRLSGSRSLGLGFRVKGLGFKV